MNPLLLKSAALVIATAIPVASLPALAGKLPSSSKSLLEVLAAVEKAGFTNVTEAGYDDGVWEVEALKEGQPVELNVSPRSLEILRSRSDEPHPALPANAKSLPDLLRMLESAGYTRVKEIDLKQNGWEVECQKEGFERDLLVDPVTGEVQSDRIDD